MIWFIIGFIAFVLITICIFCDKWRDLGEKFLTSFLTLFFSILGSILCFLVSSMIVSNFAEIEYNMVSDTKIVALKDNQDVNGDFYILGGYVNENLYYYYATETEFGYKTEKVEADNTYIQYTNGETHIERYEVGFANDRTYLLGACSAEDRYIIYCPDGTVTNEFDVDLE